MKKTILLILIIYGNTLFSQVLNNNSLYYIDSCSSLIQLTAEGYYGSTQLPLSFINVLSRGGTITPEMKTTASSRQNTINRLGGEGNIDISYYNFNALLFDKYGYYFNASSKRSAGIEYTGDLFRSVFYGNYAFQGDTIDLVKTGLHNRLYNSFQFGIVNQNLKLGLTYTSIQKEMNALIQEGGIYTSPNGTFIDAQVNGQMIETNNLPGYFQQNGWGIGVNFEFTNKLNVLDSNSNSRIVAGLNNFGLQFLNNNTSTSSIDTNFLFSGMHIQNLSDFSQSLFPQNLTDSISYNEVNHRRFGALPFELYIHKVGGKLNAKFHTTYGMRYRSQSNYSTLIYVGAEYYLNQIFTAGAIVSYGGYSKFQLGSHFRIHKDNFIMGLNTSNILGIISKNSNGLGINCSLSYQLK